MIEGERVQDGFIGTEPDRRRIIEEKDDHLSVLFLLQQALFYIGIAFPSDELDIEEDFVSGKQAVRDFFRRHFPAVPKQVQYQKMQNDIVVGKAFCFPYLKKRVGVEKVAVDRERKIGAVRCIVFPHIGRKPAFEPPPLVIIGAGTFVFEVISGLKALDEKLPDIFSCFGETPD